MPRFLDKTVWVTGASSGIGEQLALAFSASGATVILSARNEEKLIEVKNRCMSKAIIAPLDLQNGAEGLKKAKEVVAMYKIDILVNCAGISQRCLVEENLDNLEVERKVLDTNFIGAIVTTKAVLSQMIRRKEGRIVNINSISGQVGTPMRAAYSASKFAMAGYFESLRAELHAHNIKITNVYPRQVKTEISQNSVIASGKSFGRLDEENLKASDPAELAKSILCAIYNGKEEVYLCSWALYFQSLIKAWIPSLLPWINRYNLVNAMKSRDSAK